MVFPESQRVIYDKNTLSEVVCELRFPPILRIEAAPPAGFQESIRADYPLFEQRRQGPELPATVPPEVARMISMDIPGATEFIFTSADGIWSVGLTKQSLSVRTRQYVRWEDFKEHMSAPIKALREQYAPSFYRRLGLKYRNAIIRSQLGIDTDTSWSELLKPQLIGELSDVDIGPRVRTAMRQTGIELDDDGFVQLSHFVAQTKTSKEETELIYVIDADFFARKKTEVDNVWEKLDALNKESGRLFRWCITDALHNAMGPRAVEPRNG